MVTIANWRGTLMNHSVNRHVPSKLSATKAIQPAEFHAECRKGAVATMTQRGSSSLRASAHVPVESAALRLDCDGAL